MLLLNSGRYLPWLSWPPWSARYKRFYMFCNIIPVLYRGWAGRECKCKIWFCNLIRIRIVNHVDFLAFWYILQMEFFSHFRKCSWFDRSQTRGRWQHHVLEWTNIIRLSMEFVTREHITVCCSRSDKKNILCQSNLNKVKKRFLVWLIKNILYLPKKGVYYKVDKTSDKRWYDIETTSKQRWNNVDNVETTSTQLSNPTKFTRWYNVENWCWINVDSTLLCLLGCLGATVECILMKLSNVSHNKRLNYIYYQSQRSKVQATVKWQFFSSLCSYLQEHLCRYHR